MKLAAEKLARSVSAMGPDFEKKVVEENATNPRFSFLNPWNMFHPYYKDCLRVYRNEVKAERRRQRQLLKQKAVVIDAQLKARALAKELVMQQQPKEEGQSSTTSSSAFPEPVACVPDRLNEKFSEAGRDSSLLMKATQSARTVTEMSKPSTTTPPTSPTPEQDAQYKKQLERKKKAAEFMLKVQQQGA